VDDHLIAFPGRGGKVGGKQVVRGLGVRAGQCGVGVEIAPDDTGKAEPDYQGHQPAGHDPPAVPETPVR
jgi:hypothetical protein